MHEEPWLLAPQLQKERLQIIANLLIQVRGEVIERHEPEIGDTRLSLGMRAYECCRTRIIRMDIEGNFPWLSVPTPQGRFTFAFDGMPLRFSRNDPKQLPDRKLIPSDEGLIQMSMFADSNEFANLRWFLVIDTPYDLPVEHAYFIGYSESNEIVCKWEIPLSDTLPVMGEVYNRYVLERRAGKIRNLYNLEKVRLYTINYEDSGDVFLSVKISRRGGNFYGGIGIGPIYGLSPKLGFFYPLQNSIIDLFSKIALVNKKSAISGRPHGP